MLVELDENELPKISLEELNNGGYAADCAYSLA